VVVKTGFDDGEGCISAHLLRDL